MEHLLRRRGRVTPALAAASAVAVAIALHRSPAYTEATTSSSTSPGEERPQYRPQHGSGVFLWGSNKSKVVAPGEASEVVKRPKAVPFFQGAVLRDLALHEHYGVAVDATGDVYQWGDGFVSTNATSACHLTLRGLDIRRVACTSGKIFALSRSGKLYVFASSAHLQNQPGENRVKASWWPTWLGGRPDPGVDTVQVLPLSTTSKGHLRGEKFTHVVAGLDHVVALTSHGRTFSTPVSNKANNCGQLGMTTVQTNKGEVTLRPSALDSFDDYRKSGDQRRTLDVRNIPDEALKWLNRGKSLKESLVMATTEPVTNAPTTKSVEEDESSQFIRYSTTMHEIPSLRNLKITAIATGFQHSLALTSEGRALGWGSNQYGQLGVGPELGIYPALYGPTEVDWSRSSQDRKESKKCSAIAAGGNSSFWVIEKAPLSPLNMTDDVVSRKESLVKFDILAAGHGQFGGVGNGQWSHQNTPVKVKTLSGLTEWNDVSERVEPIKVHAISVGSSHVAATLDNAITQQKVSFGRDVLLWGHNADWQLGTGKRTNLATPQHLPPLSNTTNEGTGSLMPHKRMQLSLSKSKNNVTCEETLVAGWGTSGVYWRIVE